jgi:hypothetical protein
MSCTCAMLFICIMNSKRLAPVVYQSLQSRPTTLHVGAKGRGGMVPTKFTLALDRGEWSASRPGRALLQGRDSG